MSVETADTTDQTVDTNDSLDDFAKDFFGQKSEAPDTDQDSGSEQDSHDDETVDDTADKQTDAEDEAELEEEVKPKKKTVQDRIDEVVRQREELKRESEANMAELRAEIERLKTAKPAPSSAQVVPDPTAEPDPQAVGSDGNLKYELGEFDPAYIRDLTRHMLQQERERMQTESEAAKQQTAQQAEQTVRQQSWDAKVAEVTKTMPDFVEKGTALLANFNNLEPNYANYLTQVLQTMDAGPEVLYYLSNHPDEAISIINSGAQKATLALGRIESRFVNNASGTPNKVTKAPPPPPASTRSRGTNGAFVSVAPDTDDLKAFSREFFKKN